MNNAEKYFNSVDERFGVHKNNILFSMEVSEMINKQHKELLRDIRRYSNQIKKANENSLGVEIALSDFFQESTYRDASGKTNPCYNITHKGCEFIANKLTGQKGTEFTARYVNRFHELQEGNFENSLVQALNSISESMINMKTNIETRLSALELKQSQQSRYLPDKKYPSAWFKRMNPKYKMLMEYFDCTRPVLYSNIYKELEDTYDLDLNELQEEYCYENNLLKEETYPMDVIEHNKQIREAATLLVDSLLVKYGLQTDEEVKHFKRKTIFDMVPDELAVQINN